jgi:steroid delta-isomerase-like uncharacterized protein
MTNRNVEAASAQVEAFNRRDLDAQVSGYADPFRMTDHARGLTLTSRDEVKAWMGSWLQVSPDSTIEVEDVIDAGDAVVSVLAMRGTHEGPMGEVPPTGKPFTLRGVQILRFDDRGGIVTHDNFFDQLSFLVQLGLMEAPGEPG